MHGARISMAVGFGSVAIACAGGVVIGLLSGYFPGWVDVIIQRIVDTMLAFPYLILAMFIGSVAGRGTMVLIWAIGLAMAPGVVRVVRGSVLVERERDYVVAARAIGASAPRLMLRHILPNVVAPITVIATTLLAGAILSEAALSFLGLGVAPPTASWGGDLSGSARDFFEVAPWMAIFPGLALSFAVMGFNFFGDALRDVLDPRLKGTGP
jgi:peptide/nickel transport system permease protein